MNVLSRIPFLGRRNGSSGGGRILSPSDAAILSRVPDRKEREFIERWFRVPVHRFSDFSSYLETGHRKVWATYRSCKLIAATIMTATFEVGREEESAAGTRGKLAAVGTNPEAPETIRFALGGFIDRPNPYDSWADLLEMWVFHMELTGNAYWLKDEMDLKGRPTHLYPLLPQHMRYVPDKFRKVEKWVYHVNGTELKFAPEQIIHFRATNPTDLVLGMGAIEPSQSIYNAWINKGYLEEKFIENGAQPSGILSRDTELGEQIDPVGFEEFVEKFRHEYTGKKNAGKVAFLNGKWSYHKLGLTMEEMQGLEREKWNVEQIFLNHGVPLSVAGVQGAANYATARQDEINFRKYKVVPLLELLIQKINADGFIQTNGEDFWLYYSLAGLIDVEQVVREYGALLDKGALTRNELREMVGLPLIDDPLMDAFTVPQGMMTLDMLGTTQPLDGDLLGDPPPDEDDPGKGKQLRSAPKKGRRATKSNRRGRA